MNAYDPLEPPRTPLPELVDTHDLVHVGVQGDAASDYSLLVPKTWVSATRFGTPARHDGTPEPIGAFVTLPHPATPGLLVTKTVIGVHVHARDFVCHRIAEQGGVILGETIAIGPHGPRLQVAARMRDTGDIRVATAHVDGGRLFVVDAIASERLHPELHELLAPCGPSFSLAHPTGVGRLGRTRVITAGRLRVELPSDWITHVARRDTIECRTSQQKAIVRLRTPTTETTADALAARWRATMAGSGRPPKPGHQSIDAPRALDTRHAAIAIELRGCGTDRRLVLTAATRRIGEHVIDVAVLGPALHDDVAAWLRARGLIELVLATTTIAAIPQHHAVGGTGIEPATSAV